MPNINHISPEQLSKIIKPGAAGILAMTASGEFLLTKRNSKAHYLGGHWSVPSGEVDVNNLESMEDCARREFFEETTHGIPFDTKLTCIDRYFADDRMYFLFLYRVKKRFFVKIDWEHEDFNWFSKDTLPHPISSQIYDAIQRI